MAMVSGLTEWFVWINGLLDVVNVTSHFVSGRSWWDPYSPDAGYIAFAGLYGIIRVWRGADTNLVVATYMIEAFYYAYIRAPWATVACIASAAAILLLQPARPFGPVDEP